MHTLSGMASFQRARTPQQRQDRRWAILDAAGAMLAERNVQQLTLTSLSQRIGLAKSNVLRYFESREEILLVVLEQQTQDWVSALPVVAEWLEEPVKSRIELLAHTMSTTLAERPILCDLLAARTSVLEQNVSAATTAQHRRASIHTWRALAEYATIVLPELGTAGSERFSAALLLITAGVWSNSRPSAAMKDSLDSHPELRELQNDFQIVLGEVLATLLTGQLCRDASVAD